VTTQTGQTDTTIEPVVIIRPVATYPDSFTLVGDGIRDGLPEWIYDGYVRITPRHARSVVLYTATGAHDLAPVVDLMLGSDAAQTIRHAIDTPSVLVGRDDLDALREQAYEHMRTTWSTYLDGIGL
jgi:hypothetical protein